MFMNSHTKLTKRRCFALFVKERGDDITIKVDTQGFAELLATGEGSRLGV
jgi:hypothetical protein